MSNKLLFRLAVLVAAIMCALGIHAQEAYACYTPENTTLTFYYDSQRSSRPGTTYNLNTGSVNPAWYSNSMSVTQVVFDPSFAGARPTSNYRWFYNMTNLQSITGMEYLNTTSVKNMSEMFADCSGLTSLNVSGFNTTSVTNMSEMFYNCSGLTSLNVSGFNTAYVNDMNSMFNGCSGLTSLDVRGFNTANVTNVSIMFADCSGLTSLDVSNFNTSKVTNMRHMFSGCSGLTSLDLSSFKTTKVTDMRFMFNGCTGLATIYAGDGWYTAAVAESTGMGVFRNCTSLVGGQGTTYSPSHTDVDYAHIDGGPDNPGYFTEKPNEAYACYTSSNTTLTFYYDTQRGSRPGTTYDLNTDTNDPGWRSDGINSSVTQVVFDPSFADARPTSTYRWFSYMIYLQSITGMQYLNTSEVTNMTYMFDQCKQLTSIDVSGFNTANVTDMSYMFNLCSGLMSLDLSSFNTTNVTDMRDMFYYCSALTSLDVSGFNTAYVNDMIEMFRGCSALTSIDVSNFITDNVRRMPGMFFDCSGLTSLDLSSFNTDNVTTMDCMFAYSTGLTSVDLSSFTNARVSRTSNMFEGCSALTTIYASSSWYLPSNNYSWAMFMDCTSLVGGMGTTYDEDHSDGSYAHIDGGPSNPGYFTEKANFERGDVNGDGQVKINDVTALIDYLLSGNGSSINVDAADCNQDGQVKINDVTALIDYLLSGTWN